jgi:ribonuclease D
MRESNAVKHALKAAERPVLLESPEQLAPAAAEWSRHEVLGIDTEFVRETTFRADLGLVQISNGNDAWLLDPISIGTLEPLKQLLADSRITKVFHSASEDLEVLLNTTGVLAEPMVDTQLACAMLGQPLQLGYHHAVKWLYDVEIDKDQTRSNWCRRPLQARQLRYAAMDVVMLPLLLEKLKMELVKRQRWDWLVEDVARLRRKAMEQVEPDRAYLRFYGIGKLDDPTLRVLQALAAWREKTAQRTNRARGFVVSDSALRQMASLKPVNIDDLQSIEDLHPVALKKYKKKLLSLVADALASSEPIEQQFQLNNAGQRRLKPMRRTVKEAATALNLDPGLLASKRELERLIRAQLEDQPLPERFTGWRKEVITDDLLKLL